MSFLKEAFKAAKADQNQSTARRVQVFVCGTNEQIGSIYPSITKAANVLDTKGKPKTLRRAIAASANEQTLNGELATFTIRWDGKPLKCYAIFAD